MANEKNLIPFSKRTPRERSELGKKGAEKCNKVKREKQTFQKLAQQLLDMKASNKVGKYNLVEFVKQMFPEIENKEITNRAVLLATSLKEALKGNLKAVEVLRDTAGEKPIEKTENINMNTNSDLEDLPIEKLEKIKKIWDE